MNNTNSLSKEALTKWVERQNARRTMIFGVEEAITYGPIAERAGQSNRRHYAVHNSSMAKAMARDNLECLRLMPTPKLP